MIFKPENKIVWCGFGREHKNIDNALDWVREQEGYKDKSIKYVIRCDRTIEL